MRHLLAGVVLLGLAGFVQAQAQAQTQTQAQDPAPVLAAAAIDVADLDRSLAFYQSALGFRKAAAHETPAFKEYILLGPTPNSAGLVIVDKAGDAPVAAGGTRLVFYVPDAAAAVEKLKSAGATGLREPSSGGSMVIAFGRDPDGYLIELIERKAQAQ